MMWRIIPFAILWSVWKERNDRAFRGSSSSVEELSLLVVAQIANRAAFKSEFDRIKVDGELHNWEASFTLWSQEGKKDDILGSPY